MIEYLTQFVCLPVGVVFAIGIGSWAFGMLVGWSIRRPK